MSDNLPHMDYRQHRRARRLVHECCNYDEGNCLLLDDGEPCVCVQSISFSLMCHWFRVAVLPLDGELAAALLCRGSRKRCAVCGAAFVPKSNRGKYCPDCAGRMKKIKAAERKRKQRQRCHALESSRRNQITLSAPHRTVRAVFPHTALRIVLGYHICTRIRGFGI